jgi:DNA-binding winged helix-turn-helix (wHTH) protein
MQQNPFSPHSPADPGLFINREREIELIFGHIRSAQRGNVALSGPLGIGKTSLMHYVAHPDVRAHYDVQAPDYAMIYLDVHSVTPFGAVRFWRRTGRLLARQPELGLGAMADALTERPDLDVTDVEEFLDGLADQGQVLVLLLDEFEWALQADSPEAQSESRNFLAQLASLTRRAPRVMSLVVATGQQLVEATRVIEAWRGSPFATVFSTVPLKPLDRESADNLLDRATAGSGFTIEAEERQLLYAYSRGHPAALQAAAYSLFHGRQSGLAGEALREAARQAAVAAAESAEALPAVALPSTAPQTGQPVPQTGFVVDTMAGEVAIDGRRIASLTALEYSLLRLLYDSPGRLCSKEEIIRHVWGAEVQDEVDDSRVEKLISRLRRKIEPAPSRPRYIRTVRGRGYRLVP